MTRSQDELRTALIEQLHALQSSGAAFDGGHLWEAKRLATTACVLVEDSKRMKSLLSQLGLLGEMTFLASGNPIHSDNLLAETPLLLMRFGGGTVKYVPRFDDGPNKARRLPFSDWWNEAVFKDRKHRTLTRRALARSLRDQDGGAHFDEELKDEVYVGVAKENSTGWVVVTREGRRPLDNPGAHLASMRQIAWELEQTILQTGFVADDLTPPRR